MMNLKKNLVVLGALLRKNDHGDATLCLIMVCTVRLDGR